MNLHNKNTVLFVDVGWKTMDFIQIQGRMHRKKNVEEELRKLNQQISTIRKARNF